MKLYHVMSNDHAAFVVATTVNKAAFAFMDKYPKDDITRVTQETTQLEPLIVSS